MFEIMSDSGINRFLKTLIVNLPDQSINCKVARLVCFAAADAVQFNWHKKAAKKKKKKKKKKKSRYAMDSYTMHRYLTSRHGTKGTWL
jgi:hypothetical protein